MLFYVKEMLNPTMTSWEIYFLILNQKYRTKNNLSKIKQKKTMSAAAVNGRFNEKRVLNFIINIHLF